MPCTVTSGQEALAAVAELAQLGVSRVIVPAVMFRKDLAGSLARTAPDVIGRA